MDDYTDSVMIALLPTSTEWSKLECPHMTLVYAGEKEDLNSTVFNELAKDACSIAMLCSPIYLRVTGIEQFGGDEDEKVNVLRLQPSSELWAMRRMVERWNASEHPFKPHATIGPITTYVGDYPSMLGFDRIMVGWGEDKLTFWLRRN